MKLLPKSVVNVELASQKKQQIDEGLNLARKIDTLRETFVSLEEQHKNFLAGIHKELDLETKALLDNIVSLKQEISTLETKRKALLEPIDLLKKEILDEKNKVIFVSQQLQLEKIELKKKEEILEARLVKEKENLFKIRTIQNELARLQKIEEGKNKLSEENLKNSTKILEDSLKKAEEKEQQSKTREAEVAVREKQIELEKEVIEEDKQFINEEKLRLADQRGTLERAIARLNKK